MSDNFIDKGRKYINSFWRGLSTFPQVFTVVCYSRCEWVLHTAHLLKLPLPKAMKVSLESYPRCVRPPVPHLHRYSVVWVCSHCQFISFLKFTSEKFIFLVWSGAVSFLEPPIVESAQILSLSKSIASSLCAHACNLYCLRSKYGFNSSDFVENCNCILTGQIPRSSHAPFTKVFS